LNISLGLLHALCVVCVQVPFPWQQAPLHMLGMAQLVSAPCGVPPAVMQSLVDTSMQLPSIRQQASMGAGQMVVAHSVPGPCGVPLSEVQLPAGVSAQLPSRKQQASVGTQTTVPQVVPCPCGVPSCEMQLATLMNWHEPSLKQQA
jgi:hypothetical protein